MIYSILLVAGSLVLLYFGANWLVNGSSQFALKLGISPLVIGLTIVALGTSSPELLVSLMASAEGKGGIAIGNVIGSNLFNLCVILSIAALIRPLGIKMQVLKFDIPVVTLSTLLFGLFFLNRNLSQIEGLILFLFLIAYVIMNISLARKEKSKEVLQEFADEMPVPGKKWFHLAGLVIGGLIVLLVGSKLLVEGASDIARSLGVGETIIGLTIIAAGTSMPELATSAMAAFRKEYDIAVGNVIGSNIFNILGILGVSALIKPISALAISNIDLLALTVATLVLYPFFRTRYTLKRDEAVFLILIYIVYMYYLWPK